MPYTHSNGCREMAIGNVKDLSASCRLLIAGLLHRERAVAYTAPAKISGSSILVQYPMNGLKPACNRAAFDGQHDFCRSAAEIYLTAADLNFNDFAAFSCVAPKFGLAATRRVRLGCVSKQERTILYRPDVEDGHG